MHSTGVSGSVIMTDPRQFEELFWEGVDHVEIGEFPDEAAFNYFLQLQKKNSVSFGVHSPLYRNNSKYDLLEKVQYEPKHAWEQFEDEMQRLSEIGAEYILVHFPYFRQETSASVNQMIENGLQKLSNLQMKYDLPIVCEPKLGLGRSAAGIHYLDQFPLELWEKYDLHMCIDIGDYIMAVGDKALDFITKWKNHISVVHLHNVEYPGDKYLWVPVHPSHEKDGVHHKIKEIIQFLVTCSDVRFVFEHTPHSNPSREHVKEGFEWIKHLVKDEPAE